MIKPLRDRLIVRPDKPEEVTKTGIIIQATVASEPVKRGLVEEVGKGVKEVKVGEYIVYSPYHYENFDDGRIIISEEDVWAVVTK